MSRSAHRAAAAITAIIGVLLSGCGKVEIEATDPGPDEASECVEIIDALPNVMGGEFRREVLENDYAAAWGDTPIVLRCGVDHPDDFDSTLGCQKVNKINWFVPASAFTDQEADVVMTTIGRSTNVEVTLPARYRPPAEAMVDIGAVVAQHTTRVQDCGQPSASTNS